MLNVRGAARRVRRSRRTIARWIEDGDLPVALELRNDAGQIVARFIDEEQLLATFREKLQADPTRPRRRDDDTPS